MQRIAQDLATLLAPVLTFTTDEVYPLVPGLLGLGPRGPLPRGRRRPTPPCFARWEPLLAGARGGD